MKLIGQSPGGASDSTLAEIAANNASTADQTVPLVVDTRMVIEDSEGAEAFGIDEATKAVKISGAYLLPVASGTEGQTLEFDAEGNLIAATPEAGGATTLAEASANSVDTDDQTITLVDNSYMPWKDSAGNIIAYVRESDGRVVAENKKVLGQQISPSIPLAIAFDEIELVAGTPYYTVIPLQGSVDISSLEIFITEIAGSGTNVHIGLNTWSQQDTVTNEYKMYQEVTETGLAKFNFDVNAPFTSGYLFASVMSETNNIKVKCLSNALIGLESSFKSLATGLTIMPAEVTIGDRDAFPHAIYFQPRLGEIALPMPPATVWSISDDASKFFWLDPTYNDNITQTPAESGEVSSIVDRVNSVAVSSSTSYAYPDILTTLNGSQVLYFDDNDILVSPRTIPFPAGGNFQILMLVKLSSGGVNGTNDALIDFRSSSYVFKLRTSNASRFLPYLDSVVCTDIESNKGYIDDDIARVIRIKFDKTSSEITMYIHGEEVGSASDYSSAVATPLELRLPGGLGRPLFQMSHLVVTSDITEDTGQRYEAILSEIAGNRSTLAFGHPYKAVLPGV